MRLILAAIFSCALGLPASFAAPALSPQSVAMARQSAPLVQVANRKAANRQQARSHRGGRGAGGIHPLVGSGDY